MVSWRTYGVFLVVDAFDNFVHMNLAELRIALVRHR